MFLLRSRVRIVVPPGGKVRKFYLGSDLACDFGGVLTIVIEHMIGMSGDHELGTAVERTCSGAPVVGVIEDATQPSLGRPWLPHAWARARVVPISERVFGTFTQNRSGLEPARRALRTAVPLLLCGALGSGLSQASSSPERTEHYETV